MPIAIVIPAYNEAETIADVVRRACRSDARVIVVDDGSVDGTAERLRGLPAAVLRHAENRGKGASLWDGMQLAIAEGASAVVTLDADGQHRPEDIPQLVAAAIRHPDRLIVGARLRHRHRVPTSRRFANAMADFWISWAAGFPIRDTQSGFRLYPAALVSRLTARHDRGHGFVFESEVLIEAAYQGFYPLAVPIDAIYHPQARASHYRPLTDTARIVAMVAGKLLSKGMYPQGLLRSLRPSRGAP